MKKEKDKKMEWQLKPSQGKVQDVLNAKRRDTTKELTNLWCKTEEQNKRQKVNATDTTPKDNTEKAKASQTTNSPKRTKELARRSVRSLPLKNGGIIIPTTKKTSAGAAFHGGIVKPFKAPPRVSSKNPLDVHLVRGQKFTSLKNLEEARYEREKSKGKSKIWSMKPYLFCQNQPPNHFSVKTFMLSNHLVECFQYVRSGRFEFNVASDIWELFTRLIKLLTLFNTKQIVKLHSYIL